MLSLHQVSLRYGNGPPALQSVTFDLPQGAFRWLLGPSGAGKTSLLRLLTLAVRPSSGRLSVLGVRVDSASRRDLPALRRRIGMVFQDFRLLPQLSAFDNVALPLRLAGRPERQARADVAEMLHWVGLAGRAGALPAALSGGEQQRVAIARAVVARPALLLADEPTGNLDDVQAGRLMQLLAELNRLGTSVVVATHNASLAARHPAPALLLQAGRLHEAGGAEVAGWGHGGASAARVDAGASVVRVDAGASVVRADAGASVVRVDAGESVVHVDADASLVHANAPASVAGADASPSVTGVNPLQTITGANAGGRVAGVRDGRASAGAPGRG